MKSSGPRKRRTHEQRSSAMRKRLLKATLESLSVDGYAGSTLSSIVRRAGVSRGAQVHHYPSKQALMIDAAEYLLKRAYRHLGERLLSISTVDDRLALLVQEAWEQIFATPLYRAYCELLAASQRDPALSDALRQLVPRVARLFEPAANYYFESSDPKQPPADIFLQLASFLSGLALQAPLLDDDALVRAQLDGWVRQVSPLMRARKGVTTPPPRPVPWDSLLEAEAR